MSMPDVKPPQVNPPQCLTILGATGSIGVSTLDVVRQNRLTYGIYALTANTSADKLYDQCVEFSPTYAVLRCSKAAATLAKKLNHIDSKTEVLAGEGAIVAVSKDAAVDTVVAAIVGAVGLAPTLAAAQAGKKVLLANKESLVMAGSLFMNTVQTSGAKLLPVDSEHNAIFQCLPESHDSLLLSGVEKILLTGSGGPFRELDQGDLAGVTPTQACAHPNWSMGPKISVDSATMMNKGLEYIEACWLFGARPEQIDVLVHPQSIVHSMVQFRDGSVLSQMGRPDMRTPIAHCLGWPNRIDSGVKPLDFTDLGALTFYAPDFNKFPCLKMAMDAMHEGGTAGTAVNAANEVAVEAFLQERIGFTDITKIVSKVMQRWDSREPESLGAVIEADKQSRAYAAERIKQID